MRRLLNNKAFQLIAGPLLLMGVGWLSNYLWARVDNDTIQVQVDELKAQHVATDSAASALKDDVHYIRERVDAIYDRLPKK